MRSEAASSIYSRRVRLSDLKLRRLERFVYDGEMTREGILKELERVKWFLWHGNVFRDDEMLTDLMFVVDGAIEEVREARRLAHLVLKKLARALKEFGTYIDNNASGIVNMESGIDAGNVSQPAL